MASLGAAARAAAVVAALAVLGPLVVGADTHWYTANLTASSPRSTGGSQRNASETVEDDLEDSKEPSGLQEDCTLKACESHCKVKGSVTGRCQGTTCVCRNRNKPMGRCLFLFMCMKNINIYNSNIINYYVKPGSNKVTTGQPTTSASSTTNASLDIDVD